MDVRAKFTVAGMTKGKIYNVILQGDKLIQNGMIKIVIDDGTVALRAFKAFEPVM